MPIGTLSPDITPADTLIGVLGNTSNAGVPETALQSMDKLAAQLSPLMPQRFVNLAAATAFSPAAAPDYIETLGGSLIGDGEGRLYKKVASEPLFFSGKFSIELQGGATVWYKAYEPVPAKWVRGHHAAQEVAVLVMTAQSNGEGPSSGGGDLTSDPDVHAYEPNTETIVTADPAASPFTVNANNKPAFHIGKRYRERYAGKVLLFNINAGGTSIDEWMPSGNPWGLPEGEVWARLVEDIPNGLALIGQTYVDRIFFPQGESDQGTGTIVHMRKVMYLLDALRAQSWWRKGHTFMIASEMTQAFNNASQGQALALRLAAEKTSDIVVISSFDATTDPANPIHFDGPGLVDMASRFTDTLALPYGAVPRPDHFRYAASNIFFTIDAAGGANVDFTSLQQALAFFSTVVLGPSATAVATLVGKHTLVGTGYRPGLIQPGQWRFIGSLDAGYTQALKTDISATPATALTYLRTKYLAEIEATSTLMILNGLNGAHWEHVLFTCTTPGVSAAGIQSSDGLVRRNGSGGSFRAFRCAFHGWNNTGSAAFILTEATDLRLDECVISHCSTGVIADYGTFDLEGTVFAHCTGDVLARRGARGSVAGAKTTNTAATGWSAASGAVIYAITAENIGAVTQNGGGVVITA